MRSIVLTQSFVVKMATDTMENAIEAAEAGPQPSILVSCSHSSVSNMKSWTQQSHAPPSERVPLSRRSFPLVKSSTPLRLLHRTSHLHHSTELHPDGYQRAPELGLSRRNPRFVRLQTPATSMLRSRAARKKPQAGTLLVMIRHKLRPSQQSRALRVAFLERLLSRIVLTIPIAVFP